MRKTTVGLAMIVRNEEANLARCLDSVRDVVDEIVIVDTGSSDMTVEIAKLYTDKVYYFPWSGDFSAARNYALEKTSSTWILSLDADEELDPTSGDLRALVSNDQGYEAYFLPLHNLADESSVGFTRFFVLRLFCNKPEYRFQGKIHEQVVVSSPEVVGIAEGPVIWHRVVSGRDRNRKRGRNLALLIEAASSEPKNPFLQYYLGVEWLGLGKAERAVPCFQRTCEELSDDHILFRAPALRYLIASLRALQRYDEAICVCLRESLHYPFYTDLFFEGGLLFEEKGEYEIAIKWFQEAITCGQPPLLFCHTSGTESFLSLYHLGYCYEKLSRFQEARNYYQQALRSNPDYVYPVSNLFLLELSEKGPRGAFEYFQASGYLQYLQVVRVLAALFFEAGYADLACACYQEAGYDGSKLSGDDLRLLTRLQVYGGQFEEALSLFTRIREATGEEDTGLIADEVVALVLKGDYRTAKRKALSLWRCPDARSTAWALLNLITYSWIYSFSGRPEEKREPEVIRAVLEIIENCLRSPLGCSRSSDLEAVSGYRRLVSAGIKFLTHFSPQGCQALAAYLQGKARSIRFVLTARCAPLRGFFDD